MTDALPVDLRCAVQARTGEIRAVGTAVPVEALTLVELPLPWPPHVDEHTSLAGLIDVFAPLGARLQGVVPSTAATSSGQYRVTVYVRPSGPFRRYERVERVGALGDLRATSEELVLDAQAALAGAGWPAGTDSVPGASAEAAQPERELLVCTHGSRDRCCGSMGMVAFASVDQRPGVRLGRTSHLGGHRFAPTAALLPEGTVWGWLDGPALAGILDRSVPVASLIDRYRGSSAVDEPAAQAAEAAVFAEVGWAWLEAARSTEVVESGDHGWLVRVDSTAGSWTAEVVSHGSLPQPSCGSDEPSSKTDPQLEVVTLRPVR